MARHSLNPYVRLLRPLNSIMSGFGVIVGSVIVGAFYPARLLLGFIVGFLISGYAMVINDIADISVDKINAPQKPIPSGLVTVRLAAGYAAALAVLGNIAAAFLGIVPEITSLAFTALSYAYSFHLKRLGLAGNFAVALSMAIPILYGGIINGLYTPLMLSLFFAAIFAGTGREVIKGIVDVKGDSAAGIRTVAAVRGAARAAKLAAALIVVAVIISYVPPFLGLAGRALYFYLPSITFVDLLFIYSAIKVINDPSPTNSRRIKDRLLVLMLLVLLVYMITGVIENVV